MIEDINNHVDFDNMETIFLKEESDKKNVVLDPSKDSIVRCSKQLADNISQLVSKYLLQEHHSRQTQLVTLMQIIVTSMVTPSSRKISVQG